MGSLFLTKMLDYVIPCAPAVLLLNDFSTMDPEHKDAPHQPA